MKRCKTFKYSNLNYSHTIIANIYLSYEILFIVYCHQVVTVIKKECSSEGNVRR